MSTLKHLICNVIKIDVVRIKKIEILLYKSLENHAYLVHFFFLSTGSAVHEFIH